MAMLFVETSVFTQQAKVILTDEDLAAAQIALVRDPYRGALIIGGGGLRKLRVGLANRGKRGGARIIYFVSESTRTCYFLLAYRKSDTSDLTQTQLRQLRAYVEEHLVYETTTIQRPTRQH